MPKKIGVIAEDKSDVEVVTEILSKYMPRNQFSVNHFVGNGCGKVKQKCDSWTKTLINRGCEHIFILHDLDKNNESNLRKILEKKVHPNIFKNSLIIIPIEELEAWLLSDSEAIKQVFSLPKAPKKITDCESIQSPKEYLENLVWKIGRKRYLNTIHNKKISQFMSLENLVRCSSFTIFDKYICENLK